MSLDTWAPTEDRVPIRRVIEDISAWTDIADGLTISGGEPFDQPEALVELLKGVRPVIKGDILVFTGYAFEDLPSAGIASLGLIDGLVAGPFLPERACDKPLIASDNQTIRFSTKLGEERYARVCVSDSAKPRMDIIPEA